MLDLYLIRHAHTAPNARRRYPAPGQDAPLSPVGERQAARLRLPPGTVHTSPAARCVQTAQRAGYADLHRHPALREAEFGALAGHTWADLEARYGEAPAGWITALSDPESPHGPPGGESGEAFHARVQGWLAALPGDHTVLAFTHLGPVLAALRLTVRLSGAEVPPGTVVHLRRSAADWWLMSFHPGSTAADRA